MKRNFRSSVSLLLVTCFFAGLVIETGCSSLGVSNREVRAAIRKILGYPDDPYTKPIPEAPGAYKKAFDRIEKREWSNAESEFAEFLKNEPSTNWTLAAQFNWGRALEEQDRYSEALTKFQEVVQKAQNMPKIQGYALLRIGVVLEALGEDDRSLAALKDAERRSASMSREAAEVELPARLASAYARARNFKEAERYFAKADQALGRLRTESAKAGRPEWLARVLFAMGHRPNSEILWSRFEESVVPLERSQRYLLQSAEMDEEPWASMAADDLIQSYQRLRQSIDSVPAPAVSEIVIAAREQQKARWQRLVRLSDAIEKLKSYFVVDLIKGAKEDSPLLRIVNFANDLQESIEATLMLERPVDETTDRSKTRSGRVLDPKPELPGEK